MVKQLSESEFRDTFGERMLRVPSTTEPLVDIWPYVLELTRLHVLDKRIYENGLVTIVYRNDSGTYDHVLLPAKRHNAYVVIIVDLVNRTIRGHYSLDLNKEYGLE